MQRLGTAWGGSSGVPHRLHVRQQRAGRPADVDRFRAEQVLWATIGGVLGLVGGGLVGQSKRHLSVPVLVVLTLVGVALGAILRDYALTRTPLGVRRAC